MKYPVAMPDVSGNELKYLTEAIKTGWISSQGEFIKKFEKLFAKQNGMKYGVACSSGTTALTLALASLKIGEGDEVIVPEFTMIASAWAISYLGATPMFVDCRDDLNIDPDKIEEKITPRTKAIMPVHIYGRQCDMRNIKQIAYEYNLYVVEDSCEAHGVEPQGEIACFSLFANKIISSGEGGICLTDDFRLAEQMIHLRSMAFDRQHTFYHKKIGFNFRMSNLQGAVALAQTERLKEFLDKRTQITEWYDEKLKALDLQHILLLPPRNVLWMYDLLVHDRENLIKHLKKNGIETRVFFKPMSQQPMYFNPDYKLLNAYKFSLNGLYLPTYTQLTEKDIDYIVGKIKEFYCDR